MAVAVATAETVLKMEMPIAVFVVTMKKRLQKQLKSYWLKSDVKSNVRTAIKGKWANSPISFQKMYSGIQRLVSVGHRRSNIIAQHSLCKVKKGAASSSTVCVHGSMF